MLRVLSWNLFHGRARPPAGRYLLPEFTAALRSWDWDVALLQEVPPWWPAALARACDADQRRVLTSRNSLLPLRHAVAVRWPDLIKSNGGGANAILVRAGVIAEPRTRRLCLLPERRQLQAVRLKDGLWVGNLHATVCDDEAARREGRDAAAAVLDWAGGAPAVLGGDFNVREFELPGLELIGGHDVDYVFAAGLRPVGQPEVLEHGTLSDHAPVLVGVG
ncbi:MAG: endonuclease/exonuclease/phosphatase family protein [Solirubrobacteraceae bacterium]